MYGSTPCSLLLLILCPCSMFSVIEDRDTMDLILPPPQYNTTNPPSPENNSDLPLPPPPLPPKHNTNFSSPEFSAKSPFLPSVISDTSRTTTPEEWYSHDQTIGRASSATASISSEDVSVGGFTNGSTGNRRKVKKIIPEQANIFNDRVHPELRQILAQRTSGQEPVEV